MVKIFKTNHTFLVIKPNKTLKKFLSFLMKNKPRLNIKDFGKILRQTKIKGMIKMPLALTSANFESEVLKSDIPVLVDFWATWCGPCRALAPTIEELATELDGKVKVAKINVDEERDLAQKYNVMSIPTLIVFKNGEVAETAVGTRPKEDIISLIGV